MHFLAYTRDTRGTQSGVAGVAGAGCFAVSPLYTRARDNCEVTQTPLLRERDWGGFTGRYIPDLRNEPWPDDVETQENLLSRAGEFIAYVRQTFPGKKVLAVGHGIINKAVQAVYFGRSMSEVQRMMNAEVRVLEIGG